MASGVGDVFILPRVKDLWDKQLTKQGPGGWFGGGPQGPMGDVSNAMDYGRQGLWQSRGPQSTTWDPNAQWSQIQTPTGGTGALFGSSYGQGFGQGAYERFQDVGNSYLRRYGTDVTDPETGQLLIASPERGAGFRSGAQFGGRSAFNDPFTGQTYGGHREFAGLQALQQGANPYLNNPTLAAQMSQFQEIGSPFQRADPGQYMDLTQGVEGMYPTTADFGNAYVGEMGRTTGADVDRMGNMTGGMYSGVTGQTGRMTNAYEQQLMQQMAQEGQKDLSLGLQDTQSTMAAMGLGRSGQAQGTAAGVWRDIQERNALDRQNLQAQFAEQAMGRNAAAQLGMGQSALDANARAILAAQGGNINAMLGAQQAAVSGNEARLGRMHGAGMQGLNALTGSLEASRAAERQQLLGGMDRTAQWNTSQQGNYLQSLLGHDQAALNRMIAESQEQSRGMQDYTNLQQIKDQMYNDRLNTMLGLEDRFQTNQNAVLNQMAQYRMMPMDYMMQLMTGLPQGQRQPARESPWGPMLANAGLQLGGNYLSQMGQVPSAGNSAIYGGAWGNQA
jgi:hypothetical protein